MSPYRTAAVVSEGSGAPSSGDDTAMVCVVLFLVGALRLVAWAISGAAWDVELTLAAALCLFAVAAFRDRPRPPAVAHDDASPGLDLGVPPRLLPAAGVHHDDLAAAALAACLVDDSAEGRIVADLARAALRPGRRVAEQGAAYFSQRHGVRTADFALRRICVGPKHAILAHLAAASLPHEVAKRIDAIEQLGLRALVVADGDVVLGLVSLGWPAR